MPPLAVEFWFDFGSTYSYPAAMRIERLAAQAGARLAWRPFLLGPIFSQQGWDTSPFNIYLAKGRYMWRDLERICAAAGIPFQKPTVFPRNGLLAARIACHFADAPWTPAFVRSVFAANFGSDLDISDAEVIARLVSSVGQPADAIIEQAKTVQSKDRLRQQSDEAVQLGIFGAPTVCVGDELFWGNDRLEDAFDWYRRQTR